MRTLVFLTIVFFCSFAVATITFLGRGAPPVVEVRVGQPAGVTTVDFSVPANSVGSGTPVTGTPAVLVAALARHPAPRVFTLSVDSSMALSNGADTIDFTEISWISTEGDIASGSFLGTSGQVIFGPQKLIYLLEMLPKLRKT